MTLVGDLFIDHFSITGQEITKIIAPAMMSGGFLFLPKITRATLSPPMKNLEKSIFCFGKCLDSEVLILESEKVAK